MRSPAFAIAALFATAWLGGSSHGQITTPVAKSWQRADGLPQSTVHAIEQTSDGYLWLGTLGGLARFDGVRFTHFGLSDGLRGMAILDLLDDGEGGLWIASFGGGLSHWNGESIRSWTSDEGLAHNYADSLAPAGPGAVWVGGNTGLQLFKDGQFQQISALEALPTSSIGALAATASGDLWISNDNGLYFYDGDQCELVPGPAEMKNVIPHALLVDRAGDLWAGIGNGRVLRRDSRGAWIEYNTTHGLPLSYIFCLEEGAEGEIFAGSHEQGLYVFEDGKFRPVEPSGNLIGQSIRSLEVTKDGLLWVGTDASGLSRLSAMKVDYFPITHEGKVHGFVEASPGEFAVTVYSGGLLTGSLDNLQKNVSSEDFNERPFLLSAIKIASGELYFAGVGTLFKMNANSQELVKITIDEDWTALAEGEPNELWLGSRDGKLKRLVAGELQEVASGFSAISCLEKDGAGGWWISTQGAGLFHWRDGKIKQWRRADGLPTDVLRTLHLDAEGTLWIGTGGGGLAWLQGGKLNVIDRRNGLNNDFVSQILEDDHGNLWLGTQAGIAKVSKQQIAQVTSGEVDQLHPQVLDEADGMLLAECSGGFSPAGVRGSDGRFYFSTARGIVAVDPDAQVTALAPPDVRIENVSLAGEPITSMDLPPGSRELEIRFTAFDYLKPEKLRFRHRLAGQGLWIEDANKRTATFPLLPPGDYVFEVSAARANGPWGETATAMPFTVRPHFWQTNWFKVTLAFALLSIGAAVTWLVARSRVRLARGEAEVQLHRNKVAQMTRLATLGELSAALAHELNQPLSAILSNAQAAQRFLANDESDPEEIGEILKDIVADDQRASEVIDRVRAILKKSDFEPQKLQANDIVTEVLRLMGSDLKSHGISVSTALAKGLPIVRGDRVQLQQVMINLLLNARDAMQDTPVAERKLNIASRAIEKSVEISVSDNGHGFTDGDEQQIFAPYHTTKPEGLGLGLSLSQSILKSHGGRLWAENRTSGGAVFRFTIPRWEN